ncbi:hypothetical protein [Sphingomonas sp. SUN039]|uniref:hypothetical protein n=1 Tax=Sphingomonas sp. SUN039 TaxID=2937787 RepID=UPI0021645744|nr:hypothetical protein [Sphingomonas sp. SUN039]UVO53214.1 hypothetical protein M0209_03405 [Sphingomonas sp. SUN039]
MARTPKTKEAVAETAKEIVAVATPAIDDAKLSVAKVKEQASALGSEAIDSARKAATQGKDMAAEALGEISKLAESAASVVDERVGTQYGDYARKAASTVSNAATTLQNKDVDDIVADTTAFVRKRPAIAIGAVAAIGLFVVSMFRGSAKKSSDDTGA